VPVDVEFRAATEADLPVIIAMLADDQLGASREDASLPLAPAYLEAFGAMWADANQVLSVAIVENQVVGTLQITYIPGLSHSGAWRGQIEAVRVASSMRGSGLGQKLIEWAVEQCRARGCAMVQLTTNKSRKDARRFYDRLGFVASHEGYKLNI
jgi:GNAT superfamily N-acetyltransferase